MNHHILPAKIHHDDLKADIESGVSSLYQDKDVSSDVRDNIKYAVHSFVKSGNHICRNSQNKMFHKTLLDLSRDKSIKVCSFDKGNGLVILNSKDYYNKLDKIINDKTKFSIIEPNSEKPHLHPVIKKQNSVVYHINTYIKPYVDEDIVSSILPTGSQPGKLYGMCKVHKEGYPLRPVISMLNSPEYKLAKYLDNFIKPNIPISFSCDSTDLFLDNLKAFSINPNMKVVSFDVVSLFTNIPLIETINIIANSLYDINSKKTPPFPKPAFIKLLTLASQGIFMYKDKIYKQTDGVAMGSPLGPSLANFFLGHLERDKIMHSDFTPQFYNRYVDDICAIFYDSDNVQNFLDFINDLHENIKFTVEHASNTFPFLNVELKFNDFNFDSWVYRKQTHTGQLLNFTAACPDKWKKGLIICLLNIAKRLCSSEILFNNEVDKLRKMFKLNSYPISYFNKVLDSFRNPSVTQNNDNDEDANYVLIKIPFIGEQSYTLSKRIKNIIESANNCKVRIIFSSFKIRNYFSLKAKTPYHLLSNVVYKFTCQCDTETTYIGKTKRHLIIRGMEHLALSNVYSNSEVKSHLKTCNACYSNMSIDNFKIIKKCSNNFTSIIHEALLIRKLSPSLNKQIFTNGQLYTLKIFS